MQYTSRKSASIIVKLEKSDNLDEAPMAHKFCFEALDQTLRDIIKEKKIPIKFLEAKLLYLVEISDKFCQSFQEEVV